MFDIILLYRRNKYISKHVEKWSYEILLVGVLICLTI